MRKKQLMQRPSVLEHARLVLRNIRGVLVAAVKRMNTRKRSQKGNEVGTDSTEIPSDSVSNGKLLENF